MTGDILMGSMLPYILYMDPIWVSDLVKAVGSLMIRGILQEQAVHTNMGRSEVATSCDMLRL